MAKPKILVHICCAPDALYVIEKLKETYDITGYFYNPNIFPAKEYRLRLEETRKVARILDFTLLEETKDSGRWLQLTEKFQNEPEKGKRCDICYAMRLEQTARKASELGYGAFATIMSLSPWKKADVINRVGKMTGKKYGISFLEANFKKKGGFEKSIELSRKHGLYRQKYCGCLPSLKKNPVVKSSI